jgi:RimJ/RimL family protein N-acetyltransferase
VVGGDQARTNRVECDLEWQSEQRGADAKAACSQAARGGGNNSPYRRPGTSTWQTHGRWPGRDLRGAEETLGGHQEGAGGQPQGRLRSESRVSFDLQPTLKGDLLILRPLRPEDFHGLYAVASDPLIWDQHPTKDRYKEEVFQRFFHEALACGGAMTAIDCKVGQVIGSSRFHGYDHEKSEIEIGWTFLARSHWGGVYNKEMKRLMLRHAFRFVTNVIFLVGPQNVRSQRAVEKIGGVRVGVRADAAGRASLVYQITVSSAALPSSEPCE